MSAAIRATHIPANADEHNPASVSAGTAIASGLCAAVLLLSLAPLPRASAWSNHTWRVELAAGIFLFGCLAFRAAHFRLGSSLARRIVILASIFTAWGLISGTWAESFASVAHHSIVWTEYLLILTLAIEVMRTRGRTFLLTTFIWYAVIIGLVTISDYVTLPDFKTLEGTLRTRYSAYGELSIALLPTLWIAASYRRRARTWLLALLPGMLGWLSAMLSLSKGVFLAGTLGFAFTFLTAAVFGKGMHRTRMMATAGIWLAFTIAVQVGSSMLTPIPATVDYISGKADPTRETTTARVFVWKTTVPLIRDHWLAGLGADNYGIHANEGRAQFRSTHPTDPADEPISDFLWERAHNEPLQVLLELGVPGLLLFIAPFAYFIFVASRAVFARKEKPSLLFWAACGGMLAFAASSMVSSFALRIMPNGIGFFLVFALAIHELSRASRRSERTPPNELPRSAIAAVLAIMIVVLSLKGVAEYDVAVADRLTDRGQAAPLYSQAGWIDPDYAATDFRLARILYEKEDYVSAARELRQAIQGGMGVVLTYSDLATYYQKAGDRDAEFRTFDEALALYPRSVFLHVRYALELEKASLADPADAELRAARNIDRSQANGWLSIMTRGSVATFYEARNNDDVATPGALRPEIAVLQYLDKDPLQQK